MTSQDVDNYKQIKSDLDQLRSIVEKSELWVYKRQGEDGMDGDGPSESDNKKKVLCTRTLKHKTSAELMKKESSYRSYCNDISLKTSPYCSLFYRETHCLQTRRQQKPPAVTTTGLLKRYAHLYFNLLFSCL